MKRRDLIRHLENNGCEFPREGGNHTIYVNRRAQKSFRDSAASRDHRLSREKDLQRFGYSRAVTFQPCVNGADRDGGDIDGQTREGESAGSA